MAKTSETLFGKRLRDARERAGLPQEKLGVLIGIDESSSSARISRYETGAHTPSFEIAEKLAAILKIPTIYLYCRDEELANFLLELHSKEFTEYRVQIQTRA